MPPLGRTVFSPSEHFFPIATLATLGMAWNRPRRRSHCHSRRRPSASSVPRLSPPSPSHLWPVHTFRAWLPPLPPNQIDRAWKDARGPPPQTWPGKISAPTWLSSAWDPVADYDPPTTSPCHRQTQPDLGRFFVLVFLLSPLRKNTRVAASLYYWAVYRSKLDKATSDQYYLCNGMNMYFIQSYIWSIIGTYTIMYYGILFW
jgi:hypothetical protein